MPFVRPSQTACSARSTFRSARVLSTIAITVPAILLVGHVTGHSVRLGLTGSDLVMLLVSLAVSIITFASGRTHVMQGAVHLLLFLTYALLIFQQ